MQENPDLPENRIENKKSGRTMTEPAGKLVWVQIFALIEYPKDSNKPPGAYSFFGLGGRGLIRGGGLLEGGLIL